MIKYFKKVLCIFMTILYLPVIMCYASADEKMILNDLVFPESFSQDNFSFNKTTDEESLKISVIIPVYNVEEYLNECLESIIKQTYCNLDIICVNDGSTDNSLNILRHFESLDKRIKVIDQTNQGVSSARNRGMEIATGQYISFVDPDDFLAPDTYEIAMKKIKDNVDILVYGYSAFPNPTGWFITSGKSKDMIYNNDSVNAYFDCGSIGTIVWNKLYKTDLLKQYNLTFKENLKMAEDLCFNMNTFVYATKIQFINDQPYNYRLRSGSLTDVYIGQKKADNHIIAIKDVLENWQKLGLLKDNGHKVLAYIIKFSCNTIKSIKDEVAHREAENITDEIARQEFENTKDEVARQKAACELLELVWRFIDKSAKEQLPQISKDGLQYIESLALED